MRRPSLDILLALTRVNPGWGLSQSRVCALHGSTWPLWLELLARQRMGSWDLGSWRHAHMGRGWASKDSEVGKEKKEVKSA